MDAIEPIFGAADALLGVDRRQRIVLWNEAAEKLLGYSTEEVLGRNCYEVFGSRDPSGCPVCQKGCRTMQMMLRKELVPSSDLIVRAKDGGEVWVNVTTLLIPSRWRDLCVLVHLFRDVGRYQQLERFMQRLSSTVEQLCPPETSGSSVARHPSPDPPDLTAREREVLRHLASGISTAGIAKKLFISPATAKNHIHHILTKLRVHTRLEAVALTFRNGL